jgi:hypothetical protein
MQLHETGATAPNPAGDTERRPVYRWYHKLGAVAGSVFCFELGAFLLIYPWIADWNLNAAYFPAWSRDLWASAYVRGAVSGLGLLNIYISLVEVLRLRRFSG